MLFQNYRLEKHKLSTVEKENTVGVNFASSKMSDIENYLDVCRVCLTTGDELSSIFNVENFQEEIAEVNGVIMICASVQIYKDDGLSQLICSGCLEELRKSYAFKKRCEESDSFLRRNALPEEKFDTTAFTIHLDHDYASPFYEPSLNEPRIKTEYDDPEDDESEYDDTPENNIENGEDFQETDEQEETDPAVNPFLVDEFCDDIKIETTEVAVAQCSYKRPYNDGNDEAELSNCMKKLCAVQLMGTGGGAAEEESCGCNAIDEKLYKVLTRLCENLDHHEKLRQTRRKSKLPRRCEPCCKTFRNDNTYIRHLFSHSIGLYDVKRQRCKFHNERDRTEISRRLLGMI